MTAINFDFLHFTRASFSQCAVAKSEKETKSFRCNLCGEICLEIAKVIVIHQK